MLSNYTVALPHCNSYDGAKHGFTFDKPIPNNWTLILTNKPYPSPGIITLDTSRKIGIAHIYKSTQNKPYIYKCTTNNFDVVADTNGSVSGGIIALGSINVDANGRCYKGSVVLMHSLICGPKDTVYAPNISRFGPLGMVLEIEATRNAIGGKSFLTGSKLTGITPGSGIPMGHKIHYLYDSSGCKLYHQPAGVEITQLTYSIDKLNGPPPSTQYDTIVGCAGTVALFRNSNYYNPWSGITDTSLASKTSCKVNHLTVKFDSSNYHVNHVQHCGGYYKFPNGDSSKVDTTILSKFQSGGKCDSIIVTHLNIVSDSSVDNIIACNSYKWINGTTYTSNNNSALHTITNSKGCDSVFTLNLTINRSDSTRDTISSCNSHKWINGVTYTSNNNSAIHILSNSNGCDSTISLNLTINKNYSVHTYDTICKGINYRFPNGDTSTSPKIHTSYLTTNKGCDSTIVTELKVYSISSIDSVDKCNSYTWINGKTYTSNNYTDQKTFANSRGCDSTVFLKLRIRNSSSIEFVDRSCNTYLSPSGKIWSASGIYFDTIPNHLGCDSSIKVRLIIDSLNGGVLHNNNSLIAVDKNANYQWLNCDSNNAFSVLNGETSQTLIPKTNGDYAVEVSNANCIDTSTCYTITGVGIELNEFGSSLKVYPNPTTGNLSILLGNDYHNVQMTIRNSLGQVVLTKAYDVTSTLNAEIIGESGVYFIDLKTQEGKTATIRIVKE